MNNQEITLLLMKKLNLKKVHVTGDSNHINITAIGDIFFKMNEVKRQQTVYQPLMKIIEEKHIHAISIKCYTSEEWNKKNIKTI